MFNQTMESKVAVYRSTKLYQLLLILVGSLAIALSSQIIIPLVPVPVTLQTFAVMMVAMLFGWRLGSLTVLAYLAEGLLGLPVFAGWQAGPAVLLGPLGGYLIGFAFAAIATGWLLEKGFAKFFITTLIAALVGEIFIFGFGIINLLRFMPFHEAMLAGFTPFIVSEMLKIFLLALVVPKFWTK